MSKKICCIYAIINNVNNKIYIGKTIDYHGRIYKYKYLYNKPTIQSLRMPIFKAMKKYGIQNFKFEIVELCRSNEDALEKEKFWIKYCYSNNPKFGYNATTGGEGTCGFNLSKEAKLKISGEKSGKSKLTLEQVKIIREQYLAEKISRKEVLQNYNISSSTLYYLLRNISYYDENYIVDKQKLKDLQISASKFGKAKRPNLKLTDEQALDVINKYINYGYTYEKLCNEYNVSTSVIGSCLKGRRCISKLLNIDSSKARIEHFQRGSKRKNAKLNEEIVSKIKKLQGNKSDIIKIASKTFNVSESNIRNILNKKTWKHVF